MREFIALDAERIHYPILFRHDAMSVFHLRFGAVLHTRWRRMNRCGLQCLMAECEVAAWLLQRCRLRLMVGEHRVLQRMPISSPTGMTTPCMVLLLKTGVALMAMAGSPRYERPSGCGENTTRIHQTFVCSAQFARDTVLSCGTTSRERESNSSSATVRTELAHSLTHTHPLTPMQQPVPLRRRGFWFCFRAPPAFVIG